jgi:hypothetical protein
MTICACCSSEMELDTGLDVSGLYNGCWDLAELSASFIFAMYKTIILLLVLCVCVIWKNLDCWWGFMFSWQ